MRIIREAQPADHRLLTTISFRSKSYWNYPDSYLSVWKAELTITPEYINRNKVFMYLRRKESIGYYSLVVLSEDIEFSGNVLHAGWWLDHMFVLPEYIGQGIGREMFEHCLGRLAEERVEKLMILVDPFAREFYEKMGCRCLGDYPSTIPGRTTPYLEYLSAFRSSGVGRIL